MVIVLMEVVQTVTVAKVGVPREADIVLGRRPSFSAGCEFCPTGSAVSCVYGALIIIY